MDEDWIELSEPWERLRWARMRWQRNAKAVAPTAEHAAESLGMKPGTYRAYERPPDASKHIALDHQAAIEFGRKFKVSWTWLLTGMGGPDDRFPEQQERVVRAMSTVDEERQKAIADVVERLLGARTGTDG